jgi:exopolysaccharide biosynthesis protein
LNHEVVGQTPVSELGRSNGVLALRDRRGHRMEILPYDSTQVETYRRRYYAALASGPILVQDGVVPEFPTEVTFYLMRHPRTFLGWDKHRNVCLVVVDGRFPGQADGMSIPELATLARLLGLKEAINLDGGGSSTLWTDRTGILNHPFDNHVFDHAGARVVPNILIVR